MFSLGLSILFSAILLLLFRLFPRFGVRTSQAIAFNYAACVALGAFFLPPGFSLASVPRLDVVLTLVLGVCFLLTFTLTGLTTQRVGVTAASLATNLSLVVPVGLSLWVFGSAGRLLNAANYAGLGLALVAIGLSSAKPATRPVAPGKPRSAAALLPLAVFTLSGSNNTLTNFLTQRGAFAETVFTELAFAGAAAVALLALAVRVARGERLHGRSAAGGGLLGVANYLSYLFLVRALRDFGFNGALLYPLYNVGVILLAAGVAVLGFGEGLSLPNKIGLGLAVVALGLLVV